MKLKKGKTSLMQKRIPYKIDFCYVLFLYKTYCPPGNKANSPNRFHYLESIILKNLSTYLLSKSHLSYPLELAIFGMLYPINA